MPQEGRLQISQFWRRRLVDGCLVNRDHDALHHPMSMGCVLDIFVLIVDVIVVGQMAKISYSHFLVLAHLDSGSRTAQQLKLCCVGSGKAVLLDNKKVNRRLDLDN